MIPSLPNAAGGEAEGLGEQPISQESSSCFAGGVLHVVLVEPEIPPNTGNIARLCLASGARLHLIEPLGFKIDDKTLRRAGMDYWKQCDVHIWSDFNVWLENHKPSRCWFFSTKATKNYWDAKFEKGDALVFGRETRGLPESLLQEHPEEILRIPMSPEARSLNLATAVAIGLYEAWRQCSEQTA